MTSPGPDTQTADLNHQVAAHRDGDKNVVASLMARLVPDPDNVTAHRRVAVALMNHGLIVPAITAQVSCVNAGVRQQNRLADDKNLLVAMILMHGDALGASDLARRITVTWPDYTAGWVNLAYALTQTGDTAEAANAYRRVVADLPGDINAMDGLARCLGSLDEHDEAVKFGRQALEAKGNLMREKPVLWSVPSTVAVEDEEPAPSSHVIAYSLWGDDPRYISTALRNVKIARDIYPGWSCRIYHDDTVSRRMLDDLKVHGAVLVPVADRHVGKERLMWRSLVADDPQVKRFLVRDADSLLSVRERVAVDAWMTSGKPFHVLRDWYSHTDLMLAGLWDGTGGLLTGMREEINTFLATNSIIDRKIDQLFLAEVVWPSIRDATLTHDDYFGCFDAQPFPPFDMLLPGQHVGQNASVYERET
ncbi:MAG: tetratricopeptide repeat protein [Alphaproteobacteria bacterium]|nr:tetratricopeptide repeat protein [Alphaproteobacteria bacterium]